MIFTYGSVYNNNMFYLEEIIKKTQDLTNKSELIGDNFYIIYKLINSIYIDNLDKFYNKSFLEEIDSDLEIITNKLSFILNELNNFNNNQISAKELRQNQSDKKNENIIKSIHKGNFLIQNIIDQAKILESHEKKNLFNK